MTIAARVLGPANFGIYALLLTITEMVAVISGAGFGDFVTRELSRAPDDGYHVSLRITQLRLVYSAGISISMVATLLLLGYPWTVLRLALLMAATLFPRAIFETGQGAVRAAERFRSFAVLEVVQAVSLILLGAYLFHRRFGLAGAVWAELGAVSVAAFAALVAALRSFPRRSGAGPRWAHIIRRTLPFNFYPLIVQVYDRIDVVLLSKLAGDAAVGLYSLPYKLFASLQIFPYGILGTLLPALSRSNWGPDTQRLSRRVLGLLYSTALLVVLVTSLLAAPGIRLLLGESYQGSATALKILIWATVPMFLNYALNTLLLANRREKVFFITATVCVLVNVGANFVLIPHYSYRAAAAVTVITEAVLLGQNLFWVRRTLGTTILPDRLVQSTALFAVAWAGGSLASHYLPATVAALVSLLIFTVYTFLNWKSADRLI